MSTISSQLPTAVTNGTAASASTNSGFQSLTPGDFINMMVTQLQNQDPLNPTSSQDLLSQMSQIGQLQSSDTLQTTLTGLSLQNQIGSASSLIGKVIQGNDANSNLQTGTVTSVSITQTPNTASTTGSSATVNLNLDSGAVVPLGNVTSITAPTPTTTGATASGTTPTTPTTTSTSPATAASTAAAGVAALAAARQAAINAATQAAAASATSGVGLN